MTPQRGGPLTVVFNPAKVVNAKPVQGVAGCSFASKKRLFRWFNPSTQRFSRNPPNGSSARPHQPISSINYDLSI